MLDFAEVASEEMDKARPEGIPTVWRIHMCPQLRVTLFLVFGFILWLVTCVSAQTTAFVEKLPSSAPTIVYENGLLTISAHNSTLSDILRGIARQTGADIDIPPQADELVVVYLGPGPARDVVQSLLAGSRFNYVIVGSNADARTLTKILLLPILAAEKPSDQRVNTAAVQQLSVLPPETNDIEEAVQLSDNPHGPPLPVRAQQQMLQQRRQMVMQDLQRKQGPN
jgi:hypothetical protein